MISRYKTAIDLYIAQQKKVSLCTYKNKYGERSKWDDYLWVAISVETKKSYNIFFLNPDEVKRPHIANNYTGKQLLSGYLSDLAKCYALDQIVLFGFKKNTMKKIFIAKEILIKINCNIWELSQSELDSLMKGIKRHKFNCYKWFFEYCHQHNFLPKTTRFNYKVNRDTSVELALQKQYDKMPRDQIILATASIFNTIVPSVDEKINNFENVRDRFVICMCALALSSPNRLVSEQIMLNKQNLKKKLVSDTEQQYKAAIEKSKTNFPNDNNQTIHWLDWQGSKGYKDNRNHILRVMTPFVTQALNYLNKVCEPARILCRYYASPHISLKNILGDFLPEKLHGLELEKPVNLFQLGGLLGFYDNVELTKLNINGFPFSSNIDQQFVWNAKNANILLGTNTNTNRCYIPFKKDCEKFTLAELEKHWLNHIRKSVPSFPYRYIGDSGSKVKFEHALCIFLGKQVSRQKIGRAKYESASSSYAIESIDLGGLISKSLMKGGIFQRYGFADSFHIAAHQFRHYLNTKCQDSNFPELIIAMFSGRVNVESNADYDHTLGSEKIAQIANINVTQQATKSIKVVTIEKYEATTGKVAHKMSTGICTQQLHQSPCTYLNDFLTHCIGCRSSCHINKDLESIDLLEKDLAIQKHRLEEVKKNSNIVSNPILQQWFINHHRGVYILCELIRLMKSHDIKDGSLIRYAGDESCFQLIDIQKCKRIQHKLKLPNSQLALDDLLQNLKSHKQTASQGIDSLLIKLGVKDIV